MQLRRQLLAIMAITALVLSACSGAGSPTPGSESEAPSTAESMAESAAPSADATAWCDDFNFDTVEDGVLTVATYGSGPPVIIVEPNNQLSGLEGLLFNSFVEDCGLELKLFETEFASMILAVQNGEADVGTYIFYTPERAKIVYYTQPHMLVDRAIMYTQADFPWDGPDSMGKDKKVGTVTGFVWAPAIQAYWGGNATLFPDHQTGATALLQGQIDGWINGGALVNEAPFDEHRDEIALHEFEPGAWDFPAALVYNESYNIVNCGNQELAHALDKELALLVENGEWAQLMNEMDIPAEKAPRLESPEQFCS